MKTFYTTIDCEDSFRGKLYTYVDNREKVIHKTGYLDSEAEAADAIVEWAEDNGVVGQFEI